MNNLKKNLGLYLHIPFCIKKCAYCDFISFDNQNARKEDYINALIGEIQSYRDQLQDYNIDTIFIGGGTPTAMDQNQLGRIIEAVNATYPIDNPCEFTVECNPKTADISYFKLLKSLGVNRISLGAQSFLDQELKILGRVHLSDDIEKAVFDVREAGIDNINLDLMFGFFHQTEKNLFISLQKAVDLDVSHLSVYSLILEEGTAFYNMDKSPLPDEDSERRMYDHTVAFLKEHGYDRYEISNFAKENKECKHNLKYWQCSDYLGLGLNSHSFLNGTRFFNTSDLSDYISHDNKVEGQKVIEIDEQMSETMILGLRMTQGVNLSDFKNKFHIDIHDKYQKEIDQHKKNGLLVEDKNTLTLTERGIALSNYVLCDFM